MGVVRRKARGSRLDRIAAACRSLVGELNEESALVLLVALRERYAARGMSLELVPTAKEVRS